MDGVFVLRLVVQVAGRSLDVDTLMSVFAVCRKMRELMLNNYSLFAEQRRQHTLLRRVWKHGLATSKKRKVKFFKPRGIHNHVPLQGSETTMVMSRRDVHDVAFMDRLVESAGKDVLQVFDIEKGEQAYRVSIDTTEFEKQYGNIISWRHDEPSFRYMVARHFLTMEEQVESVFKRTSTGVDLTQWVHVGALKRKPDDMNFAAGLNFVEGDHGKVYIVGINCSAESEILVFDSDTLEEIATLNCLGTVRIDYSIRCSAAGKNRLCVLHKKDLYVLDVPSMNVVAKHSPDWRYLCPLSSLPPLGLECFWYGPCDILNAMTGNTIALPGTVPNALYGPMIIAISNEHVIWAEHPSGTVRMMKIGGSECVVLMKPGWKAKQYYHMSFTGRFVVWHDINKQEYHAIEVSSCPQSAAEGGKKATSSLLEKIKQIGKKK